MARVDGQIHALIDNPLPGELFDEDVEILKWQKNVAVSIDPETAEWYRKQMENWLK
jgi:hypothetical protein